MQGEIQSCCVPFVLTACLHSCSIVQLNRVMRRANATLELNEFKEFTHQDVRIFQIVKEQKLIGDGPDLLIRNLE